MFNLGSMIHGYGLIIGLAGVVGWHLAEHVARRSGFSSDQFNRAGLWVLVGGLIGARVHHVITDWPLYSDQMWQAVAIWNGGLSIIGAVIGGSLAAWWVARQSSLSIWMLLDSAVFGLPIAQAIGRWANWLNQELYGLPTDLPWAIQIDASHRLPGYETVEWYHPLFAYESILMLLFGVGVWWWYRRSKWQLGQGKFFMAYLGYYSLVRFFLEFLRLDKRVVVTDPIVMSSNQLILGGILILVMVWWFHKYRTPSQMASLEVDDAEK